MRGLSRYLSPEIRAARRKRLERVSYALNGGIFLIAAWDGATSVPHAAPLLIWTSVISGAIQLGVLIRYRGADLPERVPYALAAVGMFVNAVASIHHRTGIQYAYTFAGLLYAVLAWFGLKRIAHLIRGRKSDTLPE